MNAGGVCLFYPYGDGLFFVNRWIRKGREVSSLWGRVVLRSKLLPIRISRSRPYGDGLFLRYELLIHTLRGPVPTGTDCS